MPSTMRIKEQKRALIRRYAHADNGRGWYEVLTTLVPIALLWWAAAWGNGVSRWLTAAAVVLLMLFTIRVLVLMHECGHASLFRSRRLNRIVGFVLGVFAGMPQYVWSQHHDYHHANNGNWEKFRGPLTTPSVDEYIAMGAKKRRMYRYTRTVWLAPLGGFVYLVFNPRFTWIKGTLGLLAHLLKSKIARPTVSLREHAAGYTSRYWKSSKEYRHMTWNNLVLLGVWALMCWAVGAGLFFTVYLISVSMAGGVGIALFTVQHNFEHSYATDTARWDYDSGAAEGTSYLVLPGWLNWFTANIGYHHVHHLSARIPSYRLAQCHEEYREMFTKITRIKLSEIHHAFQCLLWDARAQRIISFAEFHDLYEIGPPAGTA